MVNYKCPRCHYTTSLKSNFSRHLNRKKICKSIFSSVSVLEICNFHNIVYSSENINHSFFGLQKTPTRTPKDSSATPKDSNLYCKYCNKKFTRCNNKNRHEKNRCTIKKNNDIILKKNNKIIKLENEIKKIKKINNSTINNTITNSMINSNNTNNLVINNFFEYNKDVYDKLNNKQNLKHINNKSFDNLLSEFCKLMYFNDKIPENKNIKCTNLQSKNCDVFIEDSFKKVSKKEAYEFVSERLALLIQDIGEENKYKINLKGEKNINLSLDTLDNPNMHYEKINNEIYNNTKINKNIDI